MNTPAHGASSKVVPLNGRGGEPGPGERVFGACRDLLQEALTGCLREAQPVISEELFALADATRDREQQVRCLDLRTIVDKDWERLAESFRREFSAEVARCQTRGKPDDTKHALEVPSFEGLTLLDDDDLSKHIVVREFAAMLSESCAEELYTLERRIGALLGADEAAGPLNPLAPPVLCHALSEACAAIVTDSETRLLLLRRLQQHLHVALPTIYQRINAYLIERGILPDLKRTYRRESSTTRASNVSAAAGAAGFPGLAGAGMEAGTAAWSSYASPPSHAYARQDNESAVATGEAILIGLQRQAQLRGAGPAAVPLTAPTSPASPASPVLLTEETRRVATRIDPHWLSSLDELQHAPTSVADEAITNRVRALSESQNGRAAAGLEAVTIDIIAMLFDFIFDDAQIPVAVKALVSRLQIPVLKVAMLDPGFFADRQHPARRFLGSISSVSIRWGDAVDESDPFFRKLAQIVEKIQNEFGSNVEIFATALGELEAFVAERQSEDEDTALAAANLVNLREAQNAAWKRAQHAVHAFCRTTRLPDLIESFLAEHWVGVLQAAALVEDEGAWQTAEQAMSDLAWSVVPKKSSDERLRLITRLPELLAQLKRGLIGVNTRAEQSSAFFDALLPYHAAALRGESVMRTAAAMAAAPITDAEDRPASSEIPPSVPDTGTDGDLLIMRSVDDGVEVEEVMLVGASPAWRPDGQEIQRQVGELKRGDWVEFVAGEHADNVGTAHRERINWISPQRAILLFSNHQSAKAISITPDALARQIRDGKARIVPPQAIFERALNGALESAHVLD